MQTKATKAHAKAQMQFRNKLALYLESKGAESPGSHGYMFRVQTPLGPLNLTLENDGVYCRFICNKSAHIWDRTVSAFNGKWNFHFDADQIATTAADVFIARIEKLLAFSPNTAIRAAVAEEIGEYNSRMAAQRRETQRV